MGPPRGLEGADCRLDSAQTNVRSPQPTIYFCKVGESPARSGIAAKPGAGPARQSALMRPDSVCAPAAGATGRLGPRA